MMRRTLAGLFILLFAATIAGAAVPIATDLQRTTATITEVDFERAEAFGNWLEQNATDASTCEQVSEEATTQAAGWKPGGGGSCGGTTCSWYQYCCNPSCGICVPYGWSCTQQSCN